MTTPQPTQTERSSAEQVARSYFDAVAARDPRRMAEHWDPEGIEDIVVFGIFRGPDEVRAFFHEFFAAIPDAETTVDRVIADDRTAVVMYRMRGTFSGGPLQGVDAPGKPVEIRGADVIDVENGRIVRNTAFSDGLDFARQIGMLPPQGSGMEKALYGAFNGMNKLRTTLEERIGGSK